MLDERPTAAELIAAVAGFLERKVAPQLEGQTAFHAKVAINALHIVMRELAEGDAANAAEAARLATLTGVSADAGLRAQNQALCARIDSGTIALDEPGLRAHLLASVRARLAIDNPKYPSLAALPPT